jgi:hypothetical protein
MSFRETPLIIFSFAHRYVNYAMFSLLRMPDVFLCIIRGGLFMDNKMIFMNSLGFIKALTKEGEKKLEKIKDLPDSEKLKAISQDKENLLFIPFPGFTIF